MKFPTIEPLESRIAPAVVSIFTPVDNPKNEGSGTDSFTDYVFKIKLDAAEASDVTVRAITRDGTATQADSDYEFKDELVTIPAGETEVTFTVKVKQDVTNEADETFAVELTTPSNNATLGTNQVGATIVNDDAFLSINDVTVTEGDNGTSTAVFTVSRTPASNFQVTVKVSTMDVSTSSGNAAGAAADFQEKTETLTFQPGESLKTFAVTINGDRSFESAEEMFKVLLSEATGAVIVDGEGIGRIQDANDPVPTISIGDAQVTEGDSGTKNLEFTVTLSALAGADVFFDVATALATGADAAASGVDFTAINLTQQSIPAGQGTVTVSVPIAGDADDELDERLLVNLTNVSTTLPGQANATALAITGGEGVGTILNDDLEVSIGATPTFTEGNSGTGQFHIPVKLSQVSSHDVLVTFTVAAGTAAAGVDFNVPANLTVLIPAGQTSADILLDVIGDTLDENDETVNVTLTGAANAQIATATAEATITDDDDEPTLTISNPTVTEGQDAVFTLTLSSASAKPVEVRWMTEAGSATSGDFTESIEEQTLTIPAGQTTGQIRVSTVNDSTDEQDETFKVNVLASTTNANVGTGVSGTATISTNDLSTLSIGDVSEVEGDAGTKTFTFTVTRSGSMTLTSTVNFTTVDGSARVTSGDYDLASGTLTFAPMDASETVSVTVHSDTTSETDETFFVSLLSPAGATNSDGVATGTIRNDEAGYKLVRVNNGPLTVDEEAAGGEQQFVEFKVVRTGKLDVPGVVFFSTAADDTVGARPAVIGTDFTSVSGSIIFPLLNDGSVSQEGATTIRVPITRDSLAEGNETFKVKLSGGVNGVVSATDGEAVVTIADNDAANLPRVIIGDVRMEEGSPGTTNMVFKVKLVGADGTTPATAGGDITVTFNVAGGTAASGTDFSVPVATTVVFTAGQTEKEISVPVTGDTADENDETLLVNLTDATFAVPGGATLPVTILDNQATGTILNDDLLLTVEAAGSEPEGLVDHARVFTVSIPQVSGHDVTVHYKTSDGTAVSTGSFADFTATEGDVTIVAGQTSATFSVQIKGDLYAEQGESFKVLFSDVRGAKLSATESALTLVNDDAVPSLTIGDATIVEGDGGRANLVFNVTLAGGTQEEVKVDFSTLDGTARAAGQLIDYVNTTGTLTFAPSPGGGTMQVSVPVLGDTWKEVNETFSVKLANARLGTNTSGVTLADDTGTGTIQDNGDALLGVIVGDARVVEGTQLSFSIETTAPVTGSAVTFKAGTRNGTARAGTDFTALNGQTLSIAVGQSSTSVVVNVTSDQQFEQSEFLFLDVSNFSAGVSPVSGGGGTVSARGIILNDDIRIVSGREFEYVDVDGDLVNVKVSKGRLSVPLSGGGTAGNDVFFTLTGTVGGRFFQRLDLSDDNLEFNGANITVTAKPQVLVTGEVLGDGKANVGAIDAALPQPGLFQFITGQSLGTVKISGDLGRIIAGSTRTPAGVRVLDVGSLGAGANIPNSPVNGLNPNSSIVLGPIGKMTVRGDVAGSLSVIGDAVDQPIPSGSVGRIGKLVVKGVLRGGTGESSGQIAFTGGIGSATLGGIVGGSGGISGALLPVDGRFTTSIGKLTVLGDIVGGSGANSGFVNTGRIGVLSLGKLKQRPTDVAIEGNLIGGSGDQSGGVFSNNNIGRVLVNGDIQGGSGSSSGRISAVHNLGSTRVTGDVIGGNKTAVTEQDAENSGVIAAGLLKGALVIEGDVKGGSGDGSGAVEISGDTVNAVGVLANVSSVTVGKRGVAGKGSIIGGSGADSGHVAIAGTVKKFLAYGDIRGGKGAGSGSLSVLSDIGNGALRQAVIKGNLIGGGTDAVGTTDGVTSLLRTGFIAADDIGRLTIEGRIEGGVNLGTGLAGSGGIFSDGAIGTLKVLGTGGTDAVKGDKSAPVVISAVEGIRSATFGGDVSFAEILAGYSGPTVAGTPRGTLVDAGANIGAIIVSGTFSASSIVAGVDAGGDGKFGTLDDQQTTTGQPANQNLISRIASVILGNAAANANASATAVFGIVAEQVNSVKVNGAAVTVLPGPHNDEIQIGGAATKIKLLEV